MNHGPSTYTVNRSLKGRRTTSFQGFGSMSVAVCGALILSFEQAQLTASQDDRRVHILGSLSGTGPENRACLQETEL